MTGRSLSEFLQDILDTISEIENFTAGVEFEAFQANREKILAVVKLIEILGEAVKKIPDEVRNRYPEIPWKSIAGMRDILVHEYWGIDVNVIWATVQEGLPPLKVVIIEIVSSDE
ncbi:hypothetical protein NIES2135_26250 [Leptolyngbya boryana NIES-2135]|jgi:uncharacterized protein with HEPN domain|uniref:DUF86 domain-containing protein n=1 Tax=Leptolyngbya boryana NIES-2135 TaxID=1973484 RepID=A0A1Z4JGE4_LEPBY|nr:MULTISPECIES: DUF86 domain-containing protein [Leptolyngbya]BAY55801.1 hypothetical protein NIES2135_26250 [Leptolyngbya boryana NIES-2135]MBD2368894.1 DUF86 domain-containing protein [Leptolyngbya sp. FACHB-161]MBD2375238.1 DUF86 domain-containing protein [Leptolyngbya sp. FACHB-238]MBD2399656.1 DUF86 domain-containing protein [Leptolyngbya sp. FACHB-239]MBD2405862.1 DUF86 domain-containing protein [Leptolyngbya sp. FACHB-402]